MAGTDLGRVDGRDDVLPLIYNDGLGNDMNLLFRFVPNMCRWCERRDSEGH